MSRVLLCLCGFAIGLIAGLIGTAATAPTRAELHQVQQEKLRLAGAWHDAEGTAVRLKTEVDRLLDQKAETEEQLQATEQKLLAREEELRAARADLEYEKMVADGAMLIAQDATSKLPRLGSYDGFEIIVHFSGAITDEIAREAGTDAAIAGRLRDLGIPEGEDSIGRLIIGVHSAGDSPLACSVTMALATELANLEIIFLTSDSGVFGAARAKDFPRELVLAIDGLAIRFLRKWRQARDAESERATSESSS